MPPLSQRLETLQNSRRRLLSQQNSQPGGAQTLQEAVATATDGLPGSVEEALLPRRALLVSAPAGINACICTGSAVWQLCGGRHRLHRDNLQTKRSHVQVNS